MGLLTVAARLAEDALETLRIGQSIAQGVEALIGQQAGVSLWIGGCCWNALAYPYAPAPRHRDSALQAPSLTGSASCGDNQMIMGALI
jgi:hypothetical protein